MNRKLKSVPVTLASGEHMWRFCENLSLIFIALRLAGFIEWPMWKVLLPIIIPCGISIALGIILGILKSIANAGKEQSS